MSKICKNYCDLFLIKNIVRPVYDHQRRCTKCDCYVPYDMIICKCCTCQTRAKPVRSKNRQKYIVPRPIHNIEF